MKYFLVTFFLLLSLAFKPDEYHLINSIPFTDVSFTTDNLGRAYVIVENQLLQFDSLGKPKGNYSEKNLGKLRSVDASNPFKLLLFYPDFAQLQLLNSKLALQSSVQLRNLDIVQPAAVCQSNQEGYWIFDLQNFILKKIDLNLRVKAESGNLSQLLGYNPLPDFMTESGNNVFVNNPETGILVFDLFGTYIKTIPLTHLKTFQVIGSELLYASGNKLMKHHLKTLQESEVLLPAHEDLVTARIGQKQLYLLTTSSLNFYSY